MEIRFLKPDITEDSLKDLKTAVQAANDEGANLDAEMIDLHCETEHPDVTFQFDFYPATRNGKSQPQSIEHNEGPSECKKRKHTPDSDSEEPIACKSFFFSRTRYKTWEYFN